MVKTKVQDLAGEFGVPTEQLMTLLKDMHVVARGPLQPLDDAQVAAVRLRWEREKRKQAAAPDEPKKPKRRSPKAAAAPEAPVAEALVSPEIKPSKRRRTAAEVAESEAVAVAEKAAHDAILDLEKPIQFERIDTPAAPPVPVVSIQERAKALFKEPAPPSADEPAAEPEPVEPPPPPAAAPGGGAPVASDSTPASPGVGAGARSQRASPSAVRTAAGYPAAGRTAPGVQLRRRPEPRSAPGRSWCTPERPSGCRKPARSIQSSRQSAASRLASPGRSSGTGRAAEPRRPPGPTRCTGRTSSPDVRARRTSPFRPG